MRLSSWARGHLEKAQVSRGRAHVQFFWVELEVPMTIMSDVKVENLLGIFGFQRKLFPLHPGVSSFTPAVPSGIRGKHLICEEPNQQLQSWKEEMEGQDTEAGQYQLYWEDHVFCCWHSWHTPGSCPAQGLIVHLLFRFCFQIVVLEKTLESPLNCKEIKPVNPKGNQLNIQGKDWCWTWSSNTLAT